MNNILVSVFPTDATAETGLRALKGLHETGDITLFASTVIAKDDQGKVATRESSDPGPVGTVVGIVTGALVGSLGGPVGVMFGAYVGGGAGLLFDMFNVGIGSDVLDDIGKQMKPGSVAIVADIDEDSTTAIDSTYQPLGAVSYRGNAGEAIDDTLNRQVDEADAEFNELKAEVRDANSEAKAAIETKLEAQAHKLDELGKAVEVRLGQLDGDLKTRVATLDAQRHTAAAQHKADIDSRIAEAKSDYELRRQKLQHAHELTAQARDLRVEALRP